MAAISSTAARNETSLAFDGLLKPLIFLTNWSEAARISPGVTGGSKLKRGLMFRHIPHSLLPQGCPGAFPVGWNCGMPPADLARLWEEHTHREFSTRDTDATLATMVEYAYVNHVPVLTGGTGKSVLCAFYSMDRAGGDHALPRYSSTSVC